MASRKRPKGGRGRKNEIKLMKVPVELVSDVEELIDNFYEQYGHYLNLPTHGLWWEVLGVSPVDPPEQVKQAYRTLSKLYHPDTSKRKDAQARSRAVNQAYAEYEALQ